MSREPYDPEPFPPLPRTPRWAYWILAGATLIVGAVWLASLFFGNEMMSGRWCDRNEMARARDECAGVLLGTFRRGDTPPEWLEKTTGDMTIEFKRPSQVYQTKQGYFYVFPLDDGDGPVLWIACKEGKAPCKGGVLGQGQGVRIYSNQPGA